MTQRHQQTLGLLSSEVMWWSARPTLQSASIPAWFKGFLTSVRSSVSKWNTHSVGLRSGDWLDQSGAIQCFTKKKKKKVFCSPCKLIVCLHYTLCCHKTGGLCIKKATFLLVCMWRHLKTRVSSHTSELLSHLKCVCWSTEQKQWKTCYCLSTFVHTCVTVLHCNNTYMGSVGYEWLTLLRMISGARYSGVPHNVQVLPFTLLAKPKSVTWPNNNSNIMKSVRAHLTCSKHLNQGYVEHIWHELPGIFQCYPSSYSYAVAAHFNYWLFSNSNWWVRAKCFWPLSCLPIGERK